MKDSHYVFLGFVAVVAAKLIVGALRGWFGISM